MVEVVAEVGRRVIPFEVKYRMHKMGLDELKGIVKFCKGKDIDKGYVMTRDLSDFTVVESGANQLLEIPAPLACCWLGQSEVLGLRPAAASNED